MHATSLANPGPVDRDEVDRLRKRFMKLDKVTSFISLVIWDTHYLTRITPAQ